VEKGEFMKIASKFICFILIFSLVSCNTVPTSKQTTNANIQQTAQTAQTVPAWTGNGGKGKSIAILSPKTRGLAEDQSYLPDLVQGEFVNNFSSYSAISVLDRVKLDEQYAEILSGYYADDAKAGQDLGHLLPTDYLMVGNITKTSTGYALQIQITKTADKMTAASYSGTCTFAEIDNLTGIRRASLDLLQKMGVQLTDRSKTELTQAATTTHVNAQTSLAQGIAAQRQGTEVAALSYYFQAAALDSSLIEATSRSSVMFANISSGNIGADTRNDIAWRRDWINRLTETEQYFSSMLSSNSLPYTLLYSTEIIPGAVNYQTETRVLSINTNLHATGGIWLSSVERALKAVYDGLNATKRKEVWGLQNWPSTGVTNLKPFDRKSKSFSITAELVNSNNNVIGSTTFQANGWWGFSTSWNSGPVISISDDDRKQISFNVKADDITDKLTIRIASVNGIDAETAARTNVLQMKALSKEEWNIYIPFSMKRGMITGYNGNMVDLIIPRKIWDESGNTNEAIKLAAGDLIIPSKIWDEPVISIGSRAFQGRKINNVIIPDSVTYIGDSAFVNNDIRKIIIGANVNIEENSFILRYNGGTSVGVVNVFFTKYYNYIGKKAGYYEYSGGRWHRYILEKVQDQEKKRKFWSSPFGTGLFIVAILGGLFIIGRIAK